MIYLGLLLDSKGQNCIYLSSVSFLATQDEDKFEREHSIVECSARGKVKEDIAWTDVSILQNILCNAGVSAPLIKIERPEVPEVPTAILSLDLSSRKLTNPRFGLSSAFISFLNSTYWVDTLDELFEYPRLAYESGAALSEEELDKGFAKLASLGFVFPAPTDKS